MKTTQISKAAWMECPLSYLQSKARYFGLSSSGSKAQIAARLVAAFRNS